MSGLPDSSISFDISRRGEPRPVARRLRTCAASKERRGNVIGHLLAYVAATAFIAIGLGALLAPATSSQQYGLATKDAITLAYVRALGVRDLVLGILLLAFALTHQSEAAGLVAEFGALVGLSDFLIVASSRGKEARSNLFIHGAGTIGLLVVWLTIRLGA
jgi:hypothetical protein